MRPLFTLPDNMYFYAVRCCTRHCLKMFRQFDFLGFYNQGDINDTVICHQNFNTLDINKAYTGLSYRCGSSYEFEIIVFINGTATSIGETLALALQHIRTATFQAFSPTDLG